MLKTVALSLAVAVVSVITLVLLRTVAGSAIQVGGEGLILILVAIVAISIVVMAVCGPVVSLLARREVSRWVALSSRAAACVVVGVILQRIAIAAFGDTNDPATILEYAESWSRRPFTNAVALAVYAVPAVLFLLAERQVRRPVDGGPEARSHLNFD